MSDKEFHIILRIDGDAVTGHAITTKEISKEYVESIFLSTNDLSDGEKTDTSKAIENEASTGSPYPEDFLAVERSFTQAMSMCQNSVIEIIRVAPIISSVMQANNIQRVVKQHGKKNLKLSSSSVEVYSLPDHAAASVNRHSEQADALRDGAIHLPKISTIGIISSYDAILAELLRVIFTSKPELIFNSDREIKFSELLEYNSIDAVRENIISNEIEGILRLSHHEQFHWMERKFKMKLTEGLDVWSDFIELCERRNLLTHTGGIVSDQYIKNCRNYGRKPKHKVGDKLHVDLDYLSQSINTVTEVGYKLIHTMWRKFAPSEREKADSRLNDFGLNLIGLKQYYLAEKLLDFGVNQKQHSSDLIKRMMVVNLANAAKLNGDKQRCDSTLDSHDWTATSFKFQICVAAVRNDFIEVERLLRMGGEVVDINPSDFRSWPVFIDARRDQAVQEAFQRVFGEPLVRSNPVVARSDPNIEDEPGEGLDNEVRPIH